MNARAILASAALAAYALLGVVSDAHAEPASCQLADPTMWPARPKPYVLLIADNSTSMGNTTVVPAAPNSCGFGSALRIDHERCALFRAERTWSGDVRFALSTFAQTQNATCSAFTCYAAEQSSTGSCLGCGPRTAGDPTTRAGLAIRVPIARDERGTGAAADARNEALQEGWVNNTCDSGSELFANGSGPLNGALRDAFRYFQNGWTAPDASASFPSPLGANDPACRSLNVILIADGDEACDAQADAVAAAQLLFATGVTVASKNYKVKTWVIQFAGGTASSFNAIAAAGGTGTATLVANETELVAAIDGIVNGLLKPEVCDNADNDCNGCTDEGFSHYANLNPACCAWGSGAQRTGCLANFAASITPAMPQGDVTKLPCTTLAQGSAESTWLCYNPRETCNAIDDNADGSVDEGFKKCGSPSHCPAAETCNGQDDDCDGVVDNGTCALGPYGPEVCDGCDNDYDGMADDGVAAVTCGSASPANCAGTRACKAAQPVTPGGCATSNTGYTACSNAPQTETCDGLDNDCNGVADDAIAATACVPAGAPPGLVYGGTSQCRMGETFCGSTACRGFIGPTPEVTDGVDNDCDGVRESFVFTNGFE